MKPASELPAAPGYTEILLEDRKDVITIGIDDGQFAGTAFCYGIVRIGEDDGVNLVPLMFTYEILECPPWADKDELAVSPEFQAEAAAILFDVVEKYEAIKDAQKEEDAN